VEERMNYNVYRNHLPYQDDPKAWRVEECRLMVEFERDLAESYGLLDHPKRSTLWHIAWNNGHASGIREVGYWYEELQELLS
jgi:hypothetical protein